VPVEDLIEIDVLMTTVGGSVEYCAAGAKPLCGHSQADAPPEMVEGAIVVQPGGAIEITIQGPVTGPLAGFYPHMWDVAQMATADYGPVLGGFPIALIQIDDGCGQSAGASAAERLLTDYPRVLGVIGPMCSTAAMGSLPRYREANLVSISGSATREDRSTQFGVDGYFNRTVLNEAQMQDLGVAEDVIDGLDGVQGFYNRYESQHGPLPTEIRPLMAYTYDAVQVLLHAIQTTATASGDGDVRVDQTALADAVRSTQGVTGLTGSIVFDEDGDRVPVGLLQD
jgi:branched-chain amino acid transport system substrate-binding protein